MLLSDLGSNVMNILSQHQSIIAKISPVFQWHCRYGLQMQWKRCTYASFIVGVYVYRDFGLAVIFYMEHNSCSSFYQSSPNHNVCWIHEYEYAWYEVHSIGEIIHCKYIKYLVHCI